MYINRLELMMVKEESVDYMGENISQIKDANSINKMFGWLRQKPTEYCYALYLSTQNQPIGYYLASKGTVDKTIFSSAEMLKPALLCNAVSMIVVHNHPSGNIEPSINDIKLTTRLYDACKLMEIKLLDHVIIGEGFYSFMKEGKINWGGWKGGINCYE